MKFLLALLTALAVASLGLANDPCPQYWIHYQGSCYRYFGDRVTWEVAKERCRDHYSINGQADLISIHSRQENSFAYDLFLSAAGGSSLAGHTYYGAWIGFYQPVAGSTDPFQWSDETVANFESWAPGEPSNGENHDEDCAYLRRFGDADDTLQPWNDIDCSSDFPYICKVAPN